MDRDLVESYNKIKDIFESGFITEHEFNNRKKELLGEKLEEFERNYGNSNSSSGSNEIPILDYNGGASTSYNSYDYNSNSSTNTYDYNNSSTSNSYDYNNTSTSYNYNPPTTSSYDYNPPTTNSYDYNSNSSASYDYNNHVVPIQSYDYNNYDSHATTPSYDYNTPSYDHNSNNNTPSYDYNSNSKVVENIFGDQEVEDDIFAVKPQPVKPKSTYAGFDLFSDGPDTDEIIQEPIRRIAPVAPQPIPAKVDRTVRDKLTEKSNNKEITYPHRVKGSYTMYKGQIDGVIAYYKTKEYLYQSALTSMDEISKLDLDIQTKFFSRYALQEIILKNYEPTDNTWLTDSNPFEEGQIFDIYDRNLKPGHYKIIPIGFKMIRRGFPTVYGEYPTTYSKDHPLAPKHFIQLEKSMKPPLESSVIDTKFNLIRRGGSSVYGDCESCYVKNYPMAPQHFIKHKPIIDPSYFFTPKTPLVIKSMEVADTRNSFNKKVLFLNHIRSLQFKGYNTQQTDEIRLSNESVQLSKLIKNCVEKSECIVCKQSAYFEFLCYSHNDANLISLYQEVKDELNKDFVTADNSSSIESEDQKESKVEVKDYSKVEKFCYTLPLDLPKSRLFQRVVKTFENYQDYQTKH